MPFANVQDYEGGVGAQDRVVIGQNVFIKAFNNTGSALSDADAVVISGLSKNSGEAASVLYPTIIVPVTSGTPVTVQPGVVRNADMNLPAGIAVGAWGWVQIAGHCLGVTKTTTANPVAIDDFLKLMNTVKTVATDGTSGSTALSQKSFAVAKSVVATGVAGTVTCWILGHEVTI